MLRSLACLFLEKSTIFWSIWSIMVISYVDAPYTRLIKVPSNKPTLLTYHDNKYLMNPCELSNLIGSRQIYGWYYKSYTYIHNLIKLCYYHCQWESWCANWYLSKRYRIRLRSIGGIHKLRCHIFEEFRPLRSRWHVYYIRSSCSSIVVIWATPSPLPSLST